MAQSLASTGTSAHIIYLPCAAGAPVKQHGTPGRNPKAVVTLRIYRRNKDIACWSAQENQREMESLRGVINTFSQILHGARYELAAREQASHAAKTAAIQPSQGASK